MPSLVIHLNISKCSSFQIGPGQNNYVPWLIQYLLLVERVTKMCVWAYGNVGCNVSSTHRERLLVPGMVDNWYWTSPPSVYKGDIKLLQICEANGFQQTIAIPERREMHQGEPHSQPALSLGTLSQPWHRLECEQSTAVLRVEKVGIRVWGNWSIWIVGQSLGEEDCADTGGPDVLVGVPHKSAAKGYAVPVQDEAHKIQLQ